MQLEKSKEEFDRPGAVGAERRASNSGENEGTKVSGMATGDIYYKRKLRDLRIKESVERTNLGLNDIIVDKFL